VVCKIFKLPHPDPTTKIFHDGERVPHPNQNLNQSFKGFSRPCGNVAGYIILFGSSTCNTPIFPYTKSTFQQKLHYPRAIINPAEFQSNERRTVSQSVTWTSTFSPYAFFTADINS
jgi:hypothetical protein